MHTPEQAKQLWCPMVRLTTCKPGGATQAGQTVLNRLQIGRETAIPDSACCVAEQCAMWRWGKLRRYMEGGVEKAVPQGYCGLAGHPEVQP